ncbi:UNVERIFIED_CONTAM: hypothetical protein GTU68_024946 [Idotea baltica]|nr:hypothetical protein [Idotea baltica]
MLVLSRKCDESIVIGNDVRVVVLGVSGNKVRLGIEAPNDIPIRRQEIVDAMNAEAAAVVVQTSSKPESGRTVTAETVG